MVLLIRLVLCLWLSCFQSITSLRSLSVASKLVIWDCDGVLVDSEALLKQAEVADLQAHGVSITVDDCVRLFSGVSTDQAADNFLGAYNRQLPPNFFERQISNSLDLFRNQLKPLMLNTITDLHKQHTKMCVASSSPRGRVDLCINVANMRPYFPDGTVFTRDQVINGKPAPDLFLLAAEKMKFKPSQCVVVEDSVAGIQAAQSANMKVIAFLGGGHAQAKWYRDAVEKLNVETAATQEEVLKAIQILNN